MRSLSVPYLGSPRRLLAARGRHALFPPKGEEEKSEGGLERHDWFERSASWQFAVGSWQTWVVPAARGRGGRALPGARDGGARQRALGVQVLAGHLGDGDRACVALRLLRRARQLGDRGVQRRLRVDPDPPR